MSNNYRVAFDPRSTRPWLGYGGKRIKTATKVALLRAAILEHQRRHNTNLSDYTLYLPG